MAKAEHAITIDRPREEVFGFLANAENDAAWRPGVLDITHSSGSGAGARYQQGVEGPFGRRISADIEITEYKPNDLIAFRRRRSFPAVAQQFSADAARAREVGA